MDFLFKDNHKESEPLQSSMRAKSRAAFTLAEVLITLGIIGIVAAMTLPTLINKHQKKVLQTAFITSYSLLGQAINGLKADTGLSSVYDYYVVYDTTRGYYMRSEFERDFAKRLKFVNFSSSMQPKYRTYDGSKEISVDASSYVIGDFKHALANGALLKFTINGSLDGQSISLTVDTNGLKPPNRYGFDVFTFLVRSSNDKLVGRKMQHLYTEDEAKDNIYSGLAGLPCSKKSKQTMNGIGCAGYALEDKCPDDPKLGYWECLPK